MKKMAISPLVYLAQYCEFLQTLQIKFIILLRDLYSV